MQIKENYESIPVKRHSHLWDLVSHLNRTPISGQELTQNPQLIKGLMDGDDYAVVFSTYRWGDNVERP